MSAFDESLHPRGQAGQFTTKTNDAPVATLSPPAPSRGCSECGASSTYRHAGIPRGYRSKSDPVYCAAHGAEQAAAGMSIEKIPTDPANVWLIEGDDHEFELVEAEAAEAALDAVAAIFEDRYGDEEDGEDYEPRDYLTVVGAFTGDPADTDGLMFIATEGAEDEGRAIEALDFV